MRRKTSKKAARQGHALKKPSRKIPRTRTERPKKSLPKHARANNPPDYFNVCIYNIGTYYTRYYIEDLVANRSWWTDPIQGGTEYPFQCMVGNGGYGELYITREESGVRNHFDWVGEGDVERV